MKNKFNFLMFIDDDVATNYYHEIIVNDSNVCNDYIFFSKAFDALEYFENLFDENKMPDIIFLDINMPRIDGWMFLDKFFEIPFDKYPKIVMLTTSLSNIEKERANNHPKIFKLLNKSLTEEHLDNLRLELLS